MQLYPNCWCEDSDNNVVEIERGISPFGEKPNIFGRRRVDVPIEILNTEIRDADELLFLNHVQGLRLVYCNRKNPYYPELDALISFLNCLALTNLSSTITNHKTDSPFVFSELVYC